jgi:hypothetical protein
MRSRPSVTITLTTLPFGSKARFVSMDTRTRVAGPNPVKIAVGSRFGVVADKSPIGSTVSIAEVLSQATSCSRFENRLSMFRTRSTSSSRMSGSVRAGVRDSFGSLGIFVKSSSNFGHSASKRWDISFSSLASETLLLISRTISNVEVLSAFLA